MDEIEKLGRLTLLPHEYTNRDRVAFQRGDRTDISSLLYESVFGFLRRRSLVIRAGRRYIFGGGRCPPIFDDILA